jgi:hypothetical protein
MNTLIDKYHALYNDMAQSADPYKMHIFGDAEKTMFTKLAAEHPDIAEEWLEMLEPTRFHNYLSEAEADKIIGHIINEDGTQSPHWDRQQVKQFVESIGHKMECEPYYNSCALYVAMNMIYSDHASSIAESVPTTAIATKLMYKMAVEKLKDKDRPHFIREYFKV